MRTTVRGIAKILILPLLVFTAGSVVSAQPSGGFRRVATEPFTGRVTVINRLKSSPPGRRIGAVSVRVPVEQAWQRARPVVMQLLLGQLNERDIGGGFRTSRNELYLAENGSLFVGTDGTGFTLRYVLAGNNLATSIRVPGPSPSGTDPRFAIGFDAEVTIDVDRSPSGGIVASPARLKLNVRRPTGQNLTGNLAIAANNLFSYVSGRDFIGQGLSVINNQQYALNAPVNVELDRMLSGLTSRKVVITPSMYTNTSGALKDTKELRLLLEDDAGSEPVVN